MVNTYEELREFIGRALERMAVARQKHPVPAKFAADEGDFLHINRLCNHLRKWNDAKEEGERNSVYDLVREELCEAVQEAANGNVARFRDELMDAVVVIFRAVENAEEICRNTHKLARGMKHDREIAD